MRGRSCGSTPSPAALARRPPPCRADAACSTGGIETAQQPVHKVTRPVAAGVVVCPDKRTPLGAQRQHFLTHHLLLHVVRRPLPQATDPLGERPSIGRLIRLPNPLPQVVEPL